MSKQLIPKRAENGMMFIIGYEGGGETPHELAKQSFTRRSNALQAIEAYMATKKPKRKPNVKKSDKPRDS